MADISDCSYAKLYPDETSKIRDLINTRIKDMKLRQEVLDEAMENRELVFMDDKDSPYRTFYRLRDKSKQIAKLESQLKNTIAKLERLLFQEDNFLLFGRRVLDELSQSGKCEPSQIKVIIEELAKSVTKVKVESEINLLPEQKITPKSIFLLGVSDKIGNALNEADKGKLLEDIFKTFGVFTKDLDTIVQTIRNDRIKQS